jgi:hypothetical protein
VEDLRRFNFEKWTTPGNDFVVRDRLDDYAAVKVRGAFNSFVKAVANGVQSQIRVYRHSALNCRESCEHRNHENKISGSKGIYVNHHVDTTQLTTTRIVKYPVIFYVRVTNRGRQSGCVASSGGRWPGGGGGGGGWVCRNDLSHSNT